MQREILLIDNSRTRVQNPIKEYVASHATQYVEGVEGMLGVTKEYIAAGGFEVVGVHGGDGTLSRITDVITQAYKKTGEMPHIVLTGGASAGTTLGELTRQGEAADIPEGLEDIFPAKDFIARVYRPPQVIYDRALDTQHIAYLLGACHLSIGGTRNVDSLQNSGIPPKLA